MSEQKPVLYYDATKNPAGVFYPGIPLADLMEADIAHLSKEQRAHLEANPMYRKTAPGAQDKPAAQEKPAEPEPVKE